MSLLKRPTGQHCIRN